MALVKCHFLRSNVVEKDAPICGVKRGQSGNHLVQEDSKTPPVAGKAVFGLAIEDLRSKILGCTNKAACFLFIPGDVFFGKTKVGQQGEAIGVN